jgi:hypothetical protein
VPPPSGGADAGSPVPPPSGGADAGSPVPPPSDAGNTGPQLLAKLPAPSGIAVDATNAYVASYEIGPVYKVPLDGSLPTVLDSLSATTIAIDATRVYTVSPSGGNAPQGLVVACAKSGCDGNYTTLASGQNGVWGIAVDDSNVYWTSQMSNSPGGLMKAPLDGGSAVPLVAATSANAIAVAGGFVFFAGSLGQAQWNLFRVPVGGGTPVALQVEGSAADSGAGTVSTVAADDRNAYYETNDGVVGQVPVDGGAPLTLFTSAHQGPPGLQIAVDAQRVYFIDGQAIRSVPIGGGPSTTIADNQSAPDGVAVDGNYVYWTNGDGTVMRALK